ncbi:MAG: hypothetical protein IJZ32_02680 [Clostridia bacterium]|nr:hypothetical protein [Clostridia bacterium]
MNEQALQKFKSQCEKFLLTISLAELRAYARDIGVEKPTKEKPKPVLISAIIAVEAGEIAPIERSKRGAPVRNTSYDKKIPETIAHYRLICFGEVKDDKEPAQEPFDFEKALKKMQSEKNELRFESPDYKPTKLEKQPKVYRGQLETLNKVSRLLPLDCIDRFENVIVPVELIRRYDLRKGDILSCHAEKTPSAYVATDILTVNGCMIEDFHRFAFEEGAACYPFEQIRLYEKERFSGVINKYFDWLIPIRKGQRGLLLSAPKSGKTTLLWELARTAIALNPFLQVFVLLVDQTPEEIGRFRKIVNPENLLYTSYEDDPERQVFVANFLLNRAKRYAECGKDVLLLVDNFNALARAYNDTADPERGKTLPCGLESSTVHFIKKYFGAARCFEKGGSLSVLGALAVDTGNPADEAIKGELLPLCNLEIKLNDRMAQRRAYPALDLSAVQIRGEETQTVAYLRNEYIPKRGTEALIGVLSESNSYEDFEEKIK